MNVSMLATLIGSYCVHRPPAPRNVGMPLSAEMPAPVRATARLAPLSSSAARATLRVWVARGLGGESQVTAVGAPDRRVGLVCGLGGKGHPWRARVLPDGHDLEDPERFRRLAL